MIKQILILLAAWPCFGFVYFSDDETSSNQWALQYRAELSNNVSAVGFVPHATMTAFAGTNIPAGACTSSRLAETNAAILARLDAMSNNLVALFPQVTNGVNGLPGAQGIQGIQGVQGISGTNGINGATGAQGIQGVAGVNGTNGVNGSNATATTNANDITTGTLAAARLPYIPLGAGSNAVSASSGWPTQWAALTITNSPWATNTAAGIIAGLGYTPLGSTSNAATATTASFVTGTLTNATTGAAASLSAPLSYANGGDTGSAATSATSGTMTVNMTNAVITITPTAACTFNASGGVTGQLATFVITTSGVTSFVLTWSTNFKVTATLATGTVTAKTFCVTFRCVNGTTWAEIGRTAAM